MANGPLSGVRILDLTHVWAGPLGTRILGDLGAEVVKIEPPMGRGPGTKPPPGVGIFLGGDAGEDPWNRQGVFVKLNRNKKSVAIDLKAPSGRETFLDLVRVADVVIENFSARAMKSLNLGFETLRDVNDQIIYIAMPGFGTTGPYSQWVAYGPSVEPMTGLGAVMGYSPEEPRNSAIALPDAIGGVSGAAAVVTALNRRRETGTGAFVELSLHEAGVSFHGDFMLDRQLGQDPKPIGNDHPAHAMSAVVRTRGEDEWIAVSCRTEDERERFESIVCDGTQNIDKHELTAALQAAGIAAGPVNITPDFLADEQVEARKFFVELSRAGQPNMAFPGNPIVIDGEFDHPDWQTAPLLGEHNREILTGWLGYDDEVVDRLLRDGVVVERPPG